MIDGLNFTFLFRLLLHSSKFKVIFFVFVAIGVSVVEDAVLFFFPGQPWPFSFSFQDPSFSLCNQTTCSVGKNFASPLSLAKSKKQYCQVQLALSLKVLGWHGRSSAIRSSKREITESRPARCLLGPSPDGFTLLFPGHFFHFVFFFSTSHPLHHFISLSIYSIMYPHIAGHALFLWSIFLRSVKLSIEWEGMFRNCLAPHLCICLLNKFSFAGKETFHLPSFLPNATMQVLPNAFSFFFCEISKFSFHPRFSKVSWTSTAFWCLSLYALKLAPVCRSLVCSPARLIKEPAKWKRVDTFPGVSQLEVSRFFFLLLSSRCLPLQYGKITRHTLSWATHAPSRCTWSNSRPD